MSDSSREDGQWIGTRRNTMATNVLLRKAHTGRPRAPTTVLPGVSHRYGAPPQKAQASVSECLAWKSQPPAAGVQITRGHPLPSKGNPGYTYGRAAGVREDIGAVLAQTSKRAYLAEAAKREAAHEDAQKKARAVARRPGKTARPSPQPRAPVRAEPKPMFRLKRFTNVPPRVVTRRDGDATPASQPVAI